MCRWRDFERSLFWLAVIGGCLILLHAFLFFVLKCKKRDSEKQGSYGALIFPRFEIFLLILALPCICQASAAIVAGILNIEKFSHCEQSFIDHYQKIHGFLLLSYKAKL